MNSKSFDLLNAPLTGKFLIEASAGTGKTFTISRLYLRLLLEKELSVENILVVTFTEAATNELKERIFSVLLATRNAQNAGSSDDDFVNGLLAKLSGSQTLSEKLDKAIHNFDQAAIFTIHKFCNRVLQEQAFESARLFDTELITEQSAFLKQISEDFWRRHMVQRSALFLSYAQSELASPDTLYELLGEVLNKPMLDIIPDLKPGETSAAEKRFQESFVVLKRSWQNCREQFVALLNTHKGLYRNFVGRLPATIGYLDLYTRFESARPLLYEHADDFTNSKLRRSVRKGFNVPRHPFLDIYETHFANWQNLKELFDAHIIHLKKRFLEEARKQLPELKARRNIYFFDDLLSNLYDALQNDPGDLAARLRQQYHAALVDEFQDTDPLQYEIFRKIFDHPGHTLFLIGDPKQAVYAFRGADIFAYMKAKNATAAQNRFTLTLNYRSEPPLVDALNAVFSRPQRPFIYEQIPFPRAEAAPDADIPQLRIAGEPGPAGMHLWFLDQRAMERGGAKPSKSEVVQIIQDAVADEIVRLLTLGREGRAHVGSGKLIEKHLAVLVRTNREAAEIQQLLKQRGVNSVLYTTDSLFSSREARELETVLAAIHEHRRPALIKAALATEMVGLTADLLLDTPENEHRLDEFFQRFATYHRTWQQAGFMRMFKSFLSDEEVIPRLMALPDGERRITNILHLVEVLQGVSSRQNLAMSGLLHWLTQQLALQNSGVEEHQLRLESDEDAVTLLTMHMSKGLQYPIVFCPFTWSVHNPRSKKGIDFHDENRDFQHVFDLGSEDLDAHKRQKKKETLAEDLRLMYVAVTRAQNRCYLVWGNMAKAESTKSAPAYLFHQPTPCDFSNPSESVSKWLNNYSAEDYERDLEKMIQEAPEAIQLLEFPEIKHATLEREKSPDRGLFCREPNVRIETAERISSYSSLISSEPRSPEDADYDSPLTSEILLPERTAEPKELYTSFLHFPKGTKTGIFVHHVLQELDYQSFSKQRQQAYIQQKLQQFGFETEWAPAIAEMLHRVLATRLKFDSGNVQLSEVPLQQRLNEIEFYFPVKAFSPHALAQIFQPLAAYPPAFAQRLQELTFTPFKGFMKGYIDLIFEQKERFFIVDWKSNFIGDRPEHYDRAALQNAMVEHYYLLQAHIYAVALEQFLRKRKPDYRHERHFGGIFYIFLRGVQADPDSETGIFYDRPSEKTTSQLRELLLNFQKES